jgi:hypothetical protein
VNCARFRREPSKTTIPPKIVTASAVRWLVQKGCEGCRVSVRSRGEHSRAAPELRAAQAQTGVVADRTLDRIRGVSHSPAAARKHTEATRPCRAADREAGHSREAARKRTVVARPSAVDRSREAGHSREAERKAVAYNQVVPPPRTRVRVALCKRRAAAHSRAVADRTAEMRRNRVVAYKRAAAAHNHAAIQKHTGYNPVLADRSREGTRTAPGSRLARKRDPQTRPRQGALPRWQSQSKSAASVLSSVSPANLNTEVGPGVPPTETRR